MQCEHLDYPVSWCYWRTHCREVHGYDPGASDPTKEVIVSSFDRSELDSLRQQFDNLLDNTSRESWVQGTARAKLQQQIDQLQKRLDEHTSKVVKRTQSRYD